MKKFSMLCVVLILWTSQLLSQDLKGTWTNQLGSTLEIEKIDKKTGRFSGYYISPTGTKGDEYDLTGYTNSLPKEEGKHNVIGVTFSVRWGGYGSLTSWTGYYTEVEGKPTIVTMWHLVRSRTELPYEHIITGSDTFYR